MAVAAFVLLQRCKWEVLPVIGLAAVVGVLRWSASVTVGSSAQPRRPVPPWPRPRASRIFSPPFRIGLSSSARVRDGDIDHQTPVPDISWARMGLLHGSAENDRQPEPGSVVTLLDQKTSRWDRPSIIPKARSWPDGSRGGGRSWIRNFSPGASGGRSSIAVHRRPGRRVVCTAWSGLKATDCPELIVDRYGAHCVVQTLTLAMDQRRDLITAALREVCAPDSIVERNDAPIRAAEGLEQRTGVLHGSAPAPFQLAMPGGVFYGPPRRGAENRPVSRPVGQLCRGGRAREREAGARLLLQPGRVWPGLRHGGADRCSDWDPASLRLGGRHRRTPRLREWPAESFISGAERL